MAKNKPTKPTNLMPRSFGGEKNNFSNDLITNGFEANVPEIYNGDNINYQLDTTGKEFEYVESVVDYIVAMPANNVLTVSANNQLDYKNLNTLATDTSVVHKTGDETVAGTKTFSDTIVGNINGNANTATKDASGNVITTTYAKKTELGKVQSVVSSGNAKYPIHLNNGTAATTNTALIDTSIYANPSTNTIGADVVSVASKVNIAYNSNTSSLDFNFV